MKTILCYGDSNTYGYDPKTGGRYPKGKRWPVLLQKKLGDDYDVVSEGLNGRTTAYDREDIFKNGYYCLKPCLYSNKPIDIVITMLGTNDCNAELNLSAEDIANGMELLIKTIEEYSLELQEFVPEIIIIAPAAILDDYANSPFADQLDEFSVIKSRAIAPLYKEIAKKHNCKFINCVDQIEVSPVDSEHLTLEGHAKLADLVYEKIMTK